MFLKLLRGILQKIFALLPRFDVIDFLKKSDKSMQPLFKPHEKKRPYSYRNLPIITFYFDGGAENFGAYPETFAYTDRDFRQSGHLHCLR